MVLISQKLWLSLDGHHSLSKSPERLRFWAAPLPLDAESTDYCKKFASYCDDGGLDVNMSEHLAVNLTSNHYHVTHTLLVAKARRLHLKQTQS